MGLVKIFCNIIQLFIYTNTNSSVAQPTGTTVLRPDLISREELNKVAPSHP